MNIPLLIGKILSLFFFLFLGFALSLNASIGSNTAVSLQANYALFPYSSIPTNQLLGFTAAQQGVVLGRSDCTASFSDFFPVSTLMDLRSGTLYLHYDLTLDQTVQFASAGSFVAAGSSALNLPVLNTTLGFPSAKNLLSFIAASPQVRTVNTTDWSFDGQYLVGGITAGTGNDLIVFSFNGSTITTMVGASLPSSIVAVRWHPTLYYIALGYASATGNDLRTYFYNTDANTLTNTGNFANGFNIQAIAWAPNGATFAFGDTSYVNIATFNSGTGAIALGPFLATSSVSTRALDWIDNNYFVAGFGTSPQLRVFDTTIATAATNAVGNTVTAVAPARFGGYVAVGLTGSTTNIRMYQWNGVSAITQIASITESLAVNSMDWSPTGSFLSIGLASSATESQIRVYYFDPVSLTFTLTGQASSPSPTINDIRWSPDSTYIATADNNTSGSAAFLRAVSVYQLLNESTPFTFQNIKMVMNSNLLAGTSMLFQGSCAIEGNENVLDLSAINSFSIDSAATLLLKNMRIQGLSGGKINFADNTGVLQLQDVTWVQTSTYTFTNGALQIQNNVLLTGTTPFIYQSTQPLTINSNSTLTFDSNMTFSYTPSSNANNLINMTDQSSILYLLNNNLIVDSMGLQLTQGTVVIDGPCSVSNTAANSTQGISFGDGASAANNCTLKILPESGFLLNSGFLIYNNV